MKLQLYTFVVGSMLLISPLHADIHTVFAHGIIDYGYKQADRHSAAFAPESGTKIVEFSDTEAETSYGINKIVSLASTYFGKPVNRSKMCMAESNDIQKVAESVDSINSQDKIILYGCSRGAATI